MDKDDQRGTWAFMGVAAVLLILYQLFFLQPAEKRRMAEQAAHRVAVAQQAANPLNAPAGSAALLSREAALAQSPRVAIDNPDLTGSIALKGARFDDLHLKGYRESVEKAAPLVEVFRPEGAKQAYFADLGWTGVPGAPNAQSLWTQTAGAALKLGQPVTFSFDGGAGLVFTRTVSLDAQYLFTVVDTVANTGAAPVKLAPYATVQRQGAPAPTVGIFEGAIGALGGVLDLESFKDLKAKGGRQAPSSGGWLGLTDKYWLSALAPAAGETVHAAYRMTPVNGVEVYEANYVGETRTLVPGAQTSETTRLFAGAKKASVLQGYETSQKLPHFSDAIDWGRLWFLTRPIFWLLSLFYGWTGSVGVAILMLTVVRVMLTFPLYNRSFASAAEMRKLQPEIEKIKERHKDDAAGAQQATMALYKERKVNPLAGCLPALVPIPVFFALSKVFTVSIELRHARFLGVPDLSAQDPSTVINLFGLLPFHPEAVPAIGTFLNGPLHIGAIAIVYGFIQWLLQAMSPSAANIDPTQRQIFMFMPLIITFFMAHVAAGLLIYWVWSSMLTIVQQYVIMHRHKTENPIDTFLAKVRGTRVPGVPAKP